MIGMISFKLGKPYFSLYCRSLNMNTIHEYNMGHIKEQQNIEMFQQFSKEAMKKGIHEPAKDPKKDKRDGTMNSGLPGKTQWDQGGLTSTGKSRPSKIGGMKLVDARSGTADELIGPSKPTKQNLKPQGPCLWGKLAKHHTKDTHILLNGHDMLLGQSGTANTRARVPKLANKDQDFYKNIQSDLGRMASKAKDPIEEDKEIKSSLTKREKFARSPKKKSLGPLIQQNQNFENKINSDLENVARKFNKTLKIDENPENSKSQTPEKLQNEPKVEHAKKQRNRAKQIFQKNSIQSEINTISDKNEIRTLKFLLEEKEKVMFKREKDIAAVNQANAKKLVDDESLIKNLKKQLKLSAQVVGRYEDGKNEIIQLKHELKKADFQRANFQIQVLDLRRMLDDTSKANFDLKQEKEKLIDNAKENDVEMGGLRIEKEIAELKLSETEQRLAEMTLEKDTEVEHKEHLACMLENRIQVENNLGIDIKCEALTKVDGEIGEPKNRADFENLDDDEPELYNNFSDYSSSSDSELADFDDFLEIKIELELQETFKDPDYGCEDPDADCKDPDNGCEVHNYGCEDPDYGCEDPDDDCKDPDNGCEVHDYGCEVLDYGCEDPDYGCEDPDTGCKDPNNGFEVHDYVCEDPNYGNERDDFNSETLSEYNFSENGYNDCAYEPDEPAVSQELNTIKDEKKYQPGPICR